MKLIIFILTFQVCSIITFGQTSDSTYTTPLLEKYVNRCMDSLETVEYLKSHALTKDMAFCNLATCLSFLEICDEDSLLNQAIYERLRQLAQYFYNEGTPILLLSSGMNSVETSRKQNMKNNLYGITYVSLGNSCISFGSMNKGITEFNLETKNLVNFQISDTKNSKVKMKRKRDTTKPKLH